MTVYRVENSLGAGMYRGCNVPSLDDAYNECRHPMPSKDSKLMRSLDDANLVGRYDEVDWSPWRFGFSSLEQMRRWLYNDVMRSDLKKAGFFVAVYESDEEHHGDTQAIFKRRGHDFVRTIDLTEI